MKRTVLRTPATAILIVAGALALAGCGSDDPGSMPGMNHSSPTSTTTSTAGEHNDADAAFATAMIPHHRQAVEMADLALKTSKYAPVTQLATAIKGAQDPEIAQMSGWLTGWGKPVPTPGMNPDGHDMGEPMAGMMTDQEMTDLAKATGTAFDRMWLQMMTKHHQGAVTMAITEQTAGKDARPVELAQKIQTDQNREIATMRQLLTQLPAS
jgi:uncharacterized protein (DUF305 family)